jgi:hypothetical protein
MSRFPAILTAIPYTHLILLTTILSVGADAANNILQKFAGGTGLVIISLKGTCLLARVSYLGMNIMLIIPQLPVFSMKNGMSYPWHVVYTNARQKEMMGEIQG